MNPQFAENGEYWHQDNVSYHRNRAEHYFLVALKASKSGNKEYAELNIKLSETHKQLSEYHQNAAFRRRVNAATTRV